MNFLTKGAIMQETYFKQLIIFKIVLFILIIIWGGTVQMKDANNSEIKNFFNIRNYLKSNTKDLLTKLKELASIPLASS